MTVLAERMLDPQRVNFYFADFYCNVAVHYVTVVVATKGSRADAFGRRRLIPIDSAVNPFLRIINNPSAATAFVQPLLYYINSNVTAWVEIYWTEDVPLEWANEFAPITPVGAGTSRLGGLEHNKACKICNLYGEEDDDDEVEEVVEAGLSPVMAVERPDISAPTAAPIEEDDDIEVLENMGPSTSRVGGGQDRRSASREDRSGEFFHFNDPSSLSTIS